MVTATPVSQVEGIFGNNAPKRGRKSVKFVMAGQTVADFFNKQGFGIVTMSWDFAAVGITATIKGRYLKDDGTVESSHAVGDASGVPLVIDMAQGANGSSIAIDAASTFDELEITFSGAVTGNVFVGLGG